MEQELNIYGDVSGGWIFSEMDKYAHTQAMRFIGHCITASASISYISRLNSEEVDLSHNTIICGETKVSITVEMRVSGNTVATASFLFIKRK